VHNRDVIHIRSLQVGLQNGAAHPGVQLHKVRCGTAPRYGLYADGACSRQVENFDLMSCGLCSCTSDWNVVRFLGITILVVVVVMRGGGEERGSLNIRLSEEVQSWDE